MDIYKKEIFAIIGPASAGKSTLLKCINRMSDFIRNISVSGSIKLDGQDTRSEDGSSLRRRVGMVSPLPVGLPMTVWDNVAFAPRMAGVRDKRKLNEIVEDCLRNAALWDEVKDRLGTLATRLSGGQQQRLTIARSLSLRPEVLCLDEFSIAIDPVTTMRIEEVLERLKVNMTIILVTNIVQQARRLAERTAMMLDGQLIEVGYTSELFYGGAKDPRTKEYIEGRFG
ncbi:MAG: ATP-binding cassette domain-containing protein [Deltaproteobacteria bacterium]|nr:ATP-binding cassette domain-containing protein [Deltaproteobacteria bacterium]